MQDALEVGIAHAHLVHMVQRVADVIDTRSALADALGDETRAAMQIEFPDVGRMVRIGDEGECADPAAAA